MIEALAWLPEGTRSIARFEPGRIAVLEFLISLTPGKPACWLDAEARMEAGYQFEVAGIAPSLFAFRGSFDRSAIEACASAAFRNPDPLKHLATEVVHEGEHTTLTTTLGVVQLWWRSDGWVVVGTRQQLAALRAASGSIRTNRCMERLIAELPPRHMAIAQCDQMFSRILGIASDGWVGGVSMVADGIEGELTVLFRDAAAAASARAVIADRAFAADVPPVVRDLLGRLPARVEETRLIFDAKLSAADLAAIDVAALFAQLARPTALPLPGASKLSEPPPPSAEQDAAQEAYARRRREHEKRMHQSRSREPR
jgi:hypothetical protein